MENNNSLESLKLARKQLVVHEQDLLKCSTELELANDKLKIATINEENLLREVHASLEEMMFTISHNIRKSVANILGISKLLCEDRNLTDITLRELLEIIITSAESLNNSTENLSLYIRLKKSDLGNINE